MRVTDKYVFFWGGEFSNFHPVKFNFKGLPFNCSEQAFMWSKAMTFDDTTSARLILSAETPKEQKALGRKVIGFDQTIWDIHKERVMESVLICKFKENTNLWYKLLSYGDREFVEASPFDKIWGVGLAEDDPRIDDPKNWLGQNLLGKTLTKIRDSLRNEFTVKL